MGYLKSNIVMLKWIIAEGYGDARTIKRRIASMEAWLENPVLIEGDKEATYHKVFDIDLAKITEPILCAPNDPDDARTLSDVAGEKIDEVFIGSCMVNVLLSKCRARNGYLIPVGAALERSRRTDAD